jgi:hypothetical protein
MKQSKIQDFMNTIDKDNLNFYLKEYNTGFEVFIALKSKNHYLNVAKSIIGDKIDFGNMQHRLIIGQVLMYQLHGKKIDNKLKEKIKIDTKTDAERYSKQD